VRGLRSIANVKFNVFDSSDVHRYCLLRLRMFVRSAFGT
jgi:hypothetical protein